MKGVLARFAERGASTQASIPGLYAWSLTVATSAWARGAPLSSKVAALAGPACLLGAVLLDRTRPVTARNLGVWGLVLSSVITWGLVPAAIGPSRLDAVRGTLGMIGWALFAFASAAPALAHDPSAQARIVARGLLPRRGARDAPFLAVGLLVAVAFQTIGWGIAVAERALFVRLFTLIAGMMVLGAFADMALARHVIRASARRRLPRGLLPWFFLFIVLLGLTVGFELT